jgi:hypothetical protein
MTSIIFRADKRVAANKIASLRSSVMEVSQEAWVTGGQFTHQRVGPKEKIKRGQIKLTEALCCCPEDVAQDYAQFHGQTLSISSGLGLRRSRLLIRVAEAPS